MLVVFIYKDTMILVTKVKFDITVFRQHINRNQSSMIDLCHTNIDCITPNTIPVTTMVSYHWKRNRSSISNHWASTPACSVVHLFINSPRHPTIIYHFSDLQEFYRFTQNVSCNRYTHSRYQQVADFTRATEYIGYMP